MASGVSVTYVFIYLLPKLRAHEDVLARHAPWVPGDENVYLIALAGLILFYAVERLVIRAEARNPGGEAEVGLTLFWSHIGIFAVNSFVIGHLLVEERDNDTVHLLLYASALGLHFMVNDHALRRRHARLHRRHGRLVLAIAVALGWAAGLADLLPDLMTAVLFSLLAGGIVFNVMKDELPSDQGGSFPAFLTGAMVYALLTILADHAT
jgi:hypothetical protein